MGWTAMCPSCTLIDGCDAGSAGLRAGEPGERSAVLDDRNAAAAGVACGAACATGDLVDEVDVKRRPVPAHDASETLRAREPQQRLCRQPTRVHAKILRGPRLQPTMWSRETRDCRNTPRELRWRTFTVPTMFDDIP